MNSRSYKERHNRFNLLASWYGVEVASTEIAAHTTQPSSSRLLQEIDKLVNQIETPENNCLFELESNWTELSGPVFARFTQPVRIVQGILELQVQHSGLIPELTPSLEVLLNRLHQNLKFKLITEIRLVISGAKRK